MKAILVIDVPDDFETKTAIAIVDVKNEKGEGVTAMCHLKPMPKKIEAPEIYELWNTDSEYIEGYNKCIDEILGETE